MPRSELIRNGCWLCRRCAMGRSCSRIGGLKKTPAPGGYQALSHDWSGCDQDNAL